MTLFEQQSCESVQVESPVVPGVTAFRGVDGVCHPVALEGLVEDFGAGPCEVGRAASYPIEFVSCLLDALEVLVQAVIFAYAAAERADIVEDVGKEDGDTVPCCFAS